MEFEVNTASVPLLSHDAPNRVFELLKLCSLPLCMLLSAAGMVTLKSAQINSSTFAFVCGILLELLAYAVYPVAMCKYSLRTISVCWTGSGTCTALVAGMTMYGEYPSTMSLVGCIMVIVGVVLQVF